MASGLLAHVCSALTLLFQEHGQHAEHKDQVSGDFPECAATKHTNNGSQGQASESSPQARTVSSESKNVIPADLIKREQDGEDTMTSPAKEDPEHPPFVSKSAGHGEAKRRLSQSVKVDKMSNWTSLTGPEDGRDELRLTAYDVIAGVISTHPIQPIEQDSDTACSNNSPILTTGKAGEPHPPSLSVTPPTSTAAAPPLATHTTTLTNKKKEQLSLVKDLDEFSKVMHQVTQEQRAKERRRDSLASELEPASYQSHPAHLLNQSSPYLAMGQPPSHHSSKNYYQQQKYTQLQAPPSAQVDSAYQPKSVTKTPMMLPGLSGSVHTESSSSSTAANHVPGTPTTPLEHFSAFHSPPPHLPLASNHSPGVQACPPPPPYSSAAICYNYTQETIHQSATSSPVTERWSLPTLPQTQQPVQQRPPMPDQMQDNSKETILAHVSSRVVSLAGQKRTIQELSSPVGAPPTKHPVGLLGHRPASTGAAAGACAHSGYSRPPGSTPYPGGPPPPLAPASVTFPHQSL